MLATIVAIMKRFCKQSQRPPLAWVQDPEAAERTTARVASLIELAIQGEALTEGEVYDCLDEDRFMTPETAIAWHALSHWWNDDDWRRDDPFYAEWQLNQITECLSSMRAEASRHG